MEWIFNSSDFARTGFSRAFVKRPSVPKLPSSSPSSVRVFLASYSASSRSKRDTVESSGMMSLKQYLISEINLAYFGFCSPPVRTVIWETSSSSAKLRIIKEPWKEDIFNAEYDFCEKYRRQTRFPKNKPCFAKNAPKWISCKLECLWAWMKVRGCGWLSLCPSLARRKHLLGFELCRSNWNACRRVGIVTVFSCAEIKNYRSVESS